MIKITNLSKIYYSLEGETKAIDNISLDINKNDFISIVGPSGSGKSTFLNILSKLDKDYEGTIKYDKDIVSSYMMQNDALIDNKTTLYNVLLGLKVMKKLNKDSYNYVIDLLNKYGLKDFINTKVSSLSGGQRQRVALIRSLSIKPNVLFLDEPFSKLDYVTKKKISEDVYNIIKEKNITCILVTHDIDEALSLSNKVIVFSKRPSVIKNIYEIEMNEIPSERRNNINFVKYYNKIWKEIE